MKTYTDLEQSKKLAEILPHNTADNTWERVTIAGNNFNVQEEQQYVHNGNMPFCFYSGIGVPCWSLAALIDSIKDKCGYFELVYYYTMLHGRANRLKNVYRLSADVYDVYENDLIDACVAMIEKLHEQKLI